MELDHGASLDVYRELEDLYRTAKGYEFSWGQIIETDSGASEGLPACREWEFVLMDPLARFHAVGGNLGEVSDICLSLLDRPRYPASDELSSAEQAPRRQSASNSVKDRVHSRPLA